MFRDLIEDGGPSSTTKRPHLVGGDYGVCYSLPPANRANDMPNAVAEVAVVAEAAAAVSRRDLAASVKRLSLLKTLAPHEPRGFFFTSARRDAPSGIGAHEPRPSAGRPSSCSPANDIPDLLIPRAQRAPSRSEPRVRRNRKPHRGLCVPAGGCLRR